MELFRKLTFRQWRQKKSRNGSQEQLLGQALEKVESEMEEKTIKKRGASVKVTKRRSFPKMRKGVSGCEHKHWESDMDERGTKLQQNLTELQASLKTCEETEKTAELQRESLKREREQLYITRLQLEASLASNRMEKVTCLQENNKLQDSLKRCEEQEKSTHLKTQRLRREIERLEIKKVQLEASLDSVQRHQEPEKEIEQLMKEKKAAHLQNITELQSFLKFDEEKSNSTELERESLMRGVGRLEENEAELLFSLKLSEEQKKSTNLETEIVMRGKEQRVIIIAELLAFLKLKEEQEQLERERCMRDREQLEKKTVQLEAGLASVRRQWEQKKEKNKQVMEERKDVHLQNITELPAFLKLCDEQTNRTGVKMKIVIIDTERLKKSILHLEERNTTEEKRIAAVLWNNRELQASLKQCEERRKFAELERESQMRYREELEKNVTQLEATLRKIDRSREDRRFIQPVKEMNTMQNMSKLQTSLTLGFRARAPEPGTRDSLAEDWKKNSSECLDKPMEILQERTHYRKYTFL